jgi:hypothetical protein
MGLGGIYDVMIDSTLKSAKIAKSHQVLSHLAYPGMGACAAPGSRQACGHSLGMWPRAVKCLEALERDAWNARAR